MYWGVWEIPRHVQHTYRLQWVPAWIWGSTMSTNIYYRYTQAWMKKGKVIEAPPRPKYHDNTGQFILRLHWYSKILMHQATSLEAQSGAKSPEQRFWAILSAFWKHGTWNTTLWRHQTHANIIVGSRQMALGWVSLACLNGKIRSHLLSHDSYSGLTLQNGLLGLPGRITLCWKQLSKIDVFTSFENGLSQNGPTTTMDGRKGISHLSPPPGGQQSILYSPGKPGPPKDSSVKISKQVSKPVSWGYLKLLYS